MSTAVADGVPSLSREEIERRAAEVLREHGLGAVPVDPVVVAGRLGVAVHNAELTEDKIVGPISKQGENVTVLVRGGHPPLRKRFTIAHEFGHHVLHLEPGDGHLLDADADADLFRATGRGQDESPPARRREIRANLFAPALLMPGPEVRAERPRLGPPDAMARRLKASAAAVGLRIEQLGLL